MMKTTPVKASGNHPKVEMTKSYVREIMKCRKKVVETMEKVFGLLAKRTHFISNNAVQSSLGSAVSPSLYINQLDEDILECFLGQEQLQRLVCENIGLLDDLLRSAEDLPFDRTLLEKITEQIKQQYLLETSIADSLAKYNDQKVEHGDLTVMLASFKHAPYIRDTDVEAVLNL